MFDLDRDLVGNTYGYHPLGTDIVAVLRLIAAKRVLVVGPAVPNVTELSGEVRHMQTPDAALPMGLYWFADDIDKAVMLVGSGLVPTYPAHVHIADLQDQPPSSTTPSIGLARSIFHPATPQRHGRKN